MKYLIIFALSLSACAPWRALRPGEKAPIHFDPTDYPDSSWRS